MLYVERSFLPLLLIIFLPVFYQTRLFVRKNMKKDVPHENNSVWYLINRISTQKLQSPEKLLIEVFRLRKENWTPVRVWHHQLNTRIAKKKLWRIKNLCSNFPTGRLARLKTNNPRFSTEVSNLGTPGRDKLTEVGKSTGQSRLATASRRGR